VLATFQITPGLREDATLALLWAWLGLRGNRQVDQLARAVLAEPLQLPTSIPSCVQRIAR
jgi:hypothetical protein